MRNCRKLKGARPSILRPTLASAERAPCASAGSGPGRGEHPLHKNLLADHRAVDEIADLARRVDSGWMGGRFDASPLYSGKTSLGPALLAPFLRLFLQWRRRCDRFPIQSLPRISSVHLVEFVYLGNAALTISPFQRSCRDDESNNPRIRYPAPSGGINTYRKKYDCPDGDQRVVQS